MDIIENNELFDNKVLDWIREKHSRTVYEALSSQQGNTITYEHILENEKKK